MFWHCQIAWEKNRLTDKDRCMCVCVYVCVCVCLYMCGCMHVCIFFFCDTSLSLKITCWHVTCSWMGGVSPIFSIQIRLYQKVLSPGDMATSIMSQENSFCSRETWTESCAEVGVGKAKRGPIDAWNVWNFFSFENLRFLEDLSENLGRSGFWIPMNSQKIAWLWLNNIKHNDVDTIYTDRDVQMITFHVSAVIRCWRSNQGNWIAATHTWRIP